MRSGPNGIGSQTIGGLATFVTRAVARGRFGGRRRDVLVVVTELVMLVALDDVVAAAAAAVVVVIAAAGGVSEAELDACGEPPQPGSAHATASAATPVKS